MYRRIAVIALLLSLVACSPGGAATFKPIVLDSLSLAEQDAVPAQSCDGCISSSPYVLAAGSGIWRLEQHAVSRYDFAGKRLASVAFDDFPISFARAGDTLWVAAAPTDEVTHVSNVERAGRLLSIDLTTGQPGVEIALNTARPTEMVVEGSFAWVAALEPTPGAPADRRLLQVDLGAARVVGEHVYELRSLVHGQLAAGASSVWVIEGSGVLRLDPSTAEQQATVDVTAESLAFSADAVWALGVLDNEGRQSVVRIDAANSTVAATIPVAGIGRQIRASDAAVWVLSSGGQGKNLLQAIDPASNAVSTTLQRDWQATYIGIH